MNTKLCMYATYEDISLFTVKTNYVIYNYMLWMVNVMNDYLYIHVCMEVQIKLIGLNQILKLYT